MHSLPNCAFDKLEDQDEHVCMVYHDAHYLLATEIQHSLILYPGIPLGI